MSSLLSVDKESTSYGNMSQSKKWFLYYDELKKILTIQAN
jgi:hypothetical protein